MMSEKFQFSSGTKAVFSWALDIAAWFLLVLAVLRDLIDAERLPVSFLKWVWEGGQMVQKPWVCLLITTALMLCCVDHLLRWQRGNSFRFGCFCGVVLLVFIWMNCCIDAMRGTVHSHDLYFMASIFSGGRLAKLVKASMNCRGGLFWVVLGAFMLIGLIPVVGLPKVYYHGFLRMNGIWVNPNLYGLLCGLILIVLWDMAASRWFGNDGKGCSEGRARNSYWSVVWPCFGGALASLGWVGSLSRGAWLAVVGVGCISCCLKRGPLSGWKSGGLLVGFVGFGLLGLFACSRSSVDVPGRMVDRVTSVSDTSDRSWMNRVVAVRFAVSQAPRRLLFGLGWDGAEEAYLQAAGGGEIRSSGAIRTNDLAFLMVSRGGCAAFLLVGFWWALVWAGRGTTAVVGALVLMAGSMFNSVLFNMILAIPLWALLLSGHDLRRRC